MKDQGQAIPGDSKQEREFWERLKKEGSELELRYARDLPDDTPEFILHHLLEFEEEVARFCFQGAEGLVLDAGCGNGNLFVHAQRLYPNSQIRYFGLDFSRNMLLRALRQDGSEKASLLQGCVDRLPFEDGIIDRVISSGVITCLSSMEEARCTLSEFHRVIKPKGQLVVDIFNRSSPFTRVRRLLGERIEPPEYISPSAFFKELERTGFRPFSLRGFDFKPFQGYLFMSRLRLLDPWFIQERFSRLIESKVAPAVPELNLLGYRIYVRCLKV